jgi:preprotein translocase subunit SecA
MAKNLLTQIFGSRNDRLLKQYRKTVERINATEPQFEKLSDDELRAKTQEFKDRVAKGESLDEILAEAFAVVREGSKRVMKMRHFDVQLQGGMALHNTKIAEMRTGEGKTLTATLPVYLNALTGKGVHVVTVNDYLANRDAQWMGKLYNFLGLSVGVNLPNMPREEKQAAYRSDITYGTNNEFGFDYLRDNMVYEVADRVQRGLNYAIVDEVDSILIDEARTPLIISGQAEDHTDLYIAMDKVVPLLSKQEGEADPRTGEGIIKPGDFTLDEKSHQVFLTEQGHENAERILFNLGLIPEGATLYDPANITLMHHLYAALRANHLYHRDQHYEVQEGEVIIVDEFTGRLMSGRRWSDGLHQAVEAKEGVAIQAENQTLASITFQNYFRLYGKLAGMTGTADTEAYEFQEIYGLETMVIPPNKPSRRDDQLDRVYKTTREKYEAAIKDIRECYERGQPVLVGTTSIENSEIIDQLLIKEGLPHQVLNAKQHAREADIVAQAGRPKMITIATNMAGRGTDIVLGGNVEKAVEAVEADESLDAGTKQSRIAQLREQWAKDHEFVVAQGGLRIIATERHESRRIDNQLRGRSGRQGDPGSSRFYLSLEDPLLRIFASDRVAAIMERLKMPDGEAIEHPWVTRSIENAQRKVEARNFDIRKHLLEYDDVANDQRKVIYQERNELLDTDDITSRLDAMRGDVVSGYIDQHIPPESLEEQWDAAGLERTLEAELQLKLPVQYWLKQEPELGEQELRNRIIEAAGNQYRTKIAQFDPTEIHRIERAIMLQSLDTHWREHLSALDALRQGIHLRGYAQKNPTQEYKREAFELFSMMLGLVKGEVTKILMTVQFRGPEELAQVEEPEAPRNVQYQHAEFGTGVAEAAEPEPDPEGEVAVMERPQPFVRGGEKVGRNDPCPCGSGKKYKHCHGRLT